MRRYMKVGDVVSVRACHFNEAGVAETASWSFAKYGDKFGAGHATVEVRGVITQRQGLALVHFSAQPEPFLTQNTPSTPRNTP